MEPFPGGLAPAHATVLTAEEFYETYAHRDFELVQGRAVPVTPTGPTHGRIDNKIARRVGQFVEDRRLGAVYTNTGFILSRNPDVVRAPDEAFVSAAAIARSPPPEHGYWQIAPDLAIEVVSPNDSAEDIAAKVADYLAAGVRLTWVLYPRLHQVHVFERGSPPRILAGAESLDGSDVLPEFRLPLEDLWR